MSVSKQAVVIVLDTSPSMNQIMRSVDSSRADKDSDDITNYSWMKQEILKNENGAEIENETMRTRLLCAKIAIERMICNIMLESITNEVGVVLLKTLETKHRFCIKDDDKK